jgi:hypothetical protein
MFKKIQIMLILISAVCLTLSAAEKYAILIAGDYTAEGIPVEQQWNEGLGDNTEFWNDLYLQWEILYKKDYKPENIKVLFAHGRDLWKEPDHEDHATRYRAENVTDDPTTTIVGYPAEAGVNGLEAAIGEIQANIGPDDFLYVWAMSHGGNPTQSSLWFLDGELTAGQFADKFDGINAYKRLFVINANYAKDFANTYLYAGDNVRVEVSTTGTPSRRADDKPDKNSQPIPHLENEEINGDVYYHGEYNFHKYAATMMETQYGSTTYNGIDLQTVDTHDDDFITFDESYEWSKNMVSDYSVTDYDDKGNLSHVPAGRNTVGYYSTFDYPTHIFNEFYGFDEDFTTPFVKGLCGVTENLDISAYYVDASVSLGSSSITKITGNNSIILSSEEGWGTYSKISLASNSVLTGENLNRLEVSPSGCSIELLGGKLQNLYILNNGLLTAPTEGTIENSKLTHNGIISVPGSTGIGGTLSIDNTEIRTSESVSSVVELGTWTGTTELRSEYVMPKIVLSNYTDWEFSGEFQGHWENGLEVTDGSRFYVTDGSSFFKA